MKVALPKKAEEKPTKKEEVNEDELPKDDQEDPDEEETADEEGGEGDEEEVVDEDADESASRKRERQLEIEKAKLEGRLEALEKNGTKTSADQQRQAQLNAVYADLSMDDDEFKEKYRGYGKAQVIQAINAELQAETTVKISKLEVKNSLARKYPNFIQHEDAIEEALADASPSVLQNPERLKKFMERTYAALEKENPTPAAPTKTKVKAKETPVKKIVRDFEPPTPRDKDKDDDEERNGDEIAEENRVLAAKFGLKSETQRKKYMSSFIPMDLGGGVRFEDPKKGFERVEPKR